MADSVDDRIVAIEFDNAKFGSKIEDTLKSLDKLQRSLDLTSLAKAAPDIDVSGADASLGRMASAVENISSKFSAMGVIGFEVIRKLTDGALNFATSAFHSVLGPIEEGGKK